MQSDRAEVVRDLRALAHRMREVADAMWRLGAGADDIHSRAVAHDLDALTGDPGIYVGIGADGAVLYVGQASSMHARVIQHWRGGRSWPRIWGMPVPWVFLDYAESLYAEMLKPAENVRFMKYLELARELLADTAKT